MLPLLARGSGSSRQLACAPPLAGGTPPSFQIEELFSNADGTVQYVILREASGSGGNHRYTSDPMIKAAMIARGYVAEGYGAQRVDMCTLAPMQVVAWQDARFSGAALDGIAVSRSIDVSGQAPRRSAPRNEPLANRLLRR